MGALDASALEAAVSCLRCEQARWMFLLPPLVISDPDVTACVGMIKEAVAGLLVDSRTQLEGREMPLRGLGLC